MVAMVFVVLLGYVLVGIGLLAAGVTFIRREKKGDEFRC